MPAAASAAATPVVLAERLARPRTMSGDRRKREATVAEVVGQRAERLGAQRDLRVQLVRGVEGDGHGSTDRGWIDERQ